MSTKIGVRWQGYLLALIVAICGAASAVAAADTVVKKEIVIGQTMPYTGPASSYSVIGRAEIAYFNKVNAEGGVNGRKIRLISLDAAYSPPKTVEQTRRQIGGASCRESVCQYV